MKITEQIANSEKTILSLEILPPLKGQGIDKLFDTLDPIMELKPKFVDVTYHRQEYVLKPRPDGGFDRVATRKRPGTVGICAAIKNKYDVEPVPHIICGGFSREETENALIDLNFLGIENVLAIRGDAMHSEKTFSAEPDGNNYAIDLVNQICGMNRGEYLDDDLQNAYPTSFCVGVAGYREKHFESPNMKSDIHFLKKKIKAGAEYIVTQMFFDNQKYFDFVDLCRSNDIHVPIIPGLKPITTLKQLSSIPTMFHVNIPEDLVDAIVACKNKDEVKRLGIEWCIAQSKELIERGVPVVHYYSMSKSRPILDIMRAVF